MKISSPVNVCVCPGSRRESEELAPTREDRRRDRFRGIGCSSVRKAASRKTRRGPEPRRLHVEQCHHAGDVSEARVPKIADGLVANIWFESTLCSSKSGEILARINSPFVVCFPKREENYEQKHYQLGKL